MKFSAAMGVCLALLGPPPEKLTPQNYYRYLAMTQVKPSELAWQQIEWRDGFWNGLVEAQAKDKPIFLWIYEGDPRGGC